MRKPRVVFPFVEAGYGHIMPLKAICECFEKKYGDKVEIVRSDFFKETNVKALIDYEKMMVKTVKKQQKRSNFFGMLTTFLMNFFGVRTSSWFVNQVMSPKAFKEGVKHMKELEPDLVFSTHWSVNYYAEHIKKNKPITIMFCPDVIINPMFSYFCDLELTGMKLGYTQAMKRKLRYNEKNLKLVPFLIRNEAFDIPMDKKVNRRNLGFPEDKFTIVLAEGGYGLGKMKDITEKLIKTHLPITVIPVCGTNKELYEYFKTLKPSDEVTFLPQPFLNNMLEVIASADLFMGKSGNIISEPCFFGVPEIITSHQTLIERDIARHYVYYVGSAIDEFNVDKIIKLTEKFVNEPETLQPYIKAALRNHENYGAEKTADIIYEELKKRFPEL